MTKIIMVVLVIFSSCVTERTVLIGQDNAGYLLVNKTRHTGTKQQLLDFFYAKGIKPKPIGFSLPKDILLVPEYEQHNHSPKKGFVVYKQRDYFWRRVTFLPSVDSVCSITALSEEAVCVVFNNSQRLYRFKPAEPGYSEKWLPSKFAP